MLKLEHVFKSFNTGTADEFPLFRDFSFAVEPGEFVSVVGSNGSGKTTLLNLVCGSLAADSGRIWFDGRDITAMKEYRRAAFIGRVFQDPQKGSCGELTILENMALADNKKGRFGLGRAVNGKRTAYYRSLLETCGMGLEDKLGVPVRSLSGGQRQALALVIAGMTDIRLLILDEHTAALDPQSSETVMRLTDRLVKEKQVTTLMVTHNLLFALRYGSRLVMMHEGRCLTDVRGPEKQRLRREDILDQFNRISLEYGN